MIFVGIPVLSRFDLLAKAVACLDVPHELYVVDNSANNRGVAASWNAILREGFERGYGWVFIGNDDCFVAPGTLQKAADCIRNDRAGIWHILSWAFFAVSRATVERVGYFDEKFYPCYYTDTDYSRRCDLAGVVRREVPGAEAEHLSETARKDGHDMGDSLPYYVSKWGGVPGQERFVIPFVDPHKPPDRRFDRRPAAAARRRYER